MTVPGGTLTSRIFHDSKLPRAIVSLEGLPLHVNQAMTLFLGYTEAQLQQMHFKDFTVEEYVGGDLQNFADLVAEKIKYYQYTKEWKHGQQGRVRGDMTCELLDVDGERYCLATIFPRPLPAHSEEEEIVKGNGIVTPESPAWLKAWVFISRGKRPVLLTVLLVVILLTVWFTLLGGADRLLGP